MYDFTVSYSVSPVTSFSPLSEPTSLSLSVPTHQLSPPLCFSKWKPPVSFEIFKQRAPHIFWYATDSKDHLFYMVLQRIRKSPLLHFINLFVSAYLPSPAPPSLPRGSLVDGRRRNSLFHFWIERDIEAILQWFPKCYLSVLSFSCCWEQYSLDRILIISNYNVPDLERKRTLLPPNPDHRQKGRKKNK